MHTLTSIFNIFNRTKNNREYQIALAQTHAETVRYKAMQIFEQADAANVACDIAIAARKRANDAAYAAAREVQAADRAVAAIKK
jgi:hypothetical protein